MDYLDIELKGLDKDGKEKDIKLSDFKGKNVILYFYPKDDTPICTQESHDFKDKIDEIGEDAVIIGVSPDNIESHKRFREKYHLNFHLLSDVEHKLARLLGAFKKKDENKSEEFIRSTFVLDKDGKIKKSWIGVNIKGHVDEVLKHVK